MTELSYMTHPSIWFEGSVSEAVNIANSNNSVLLVCLIQNSENDTESALFESRFTDEKAVSKLSDLNLVSLRLINDSPDGIMFSQIFPVMVVPSLYIIRNGLLADFMNSSVDNDQMMERIKNAVNGQSKIPPPPNFVGSGSEISSSNSQNHSNAGSIATPSIPTVNSQNNMTSSAAETSSPSPSSVAGSSTPSDSPIPSSDRSKNLKSLMEERKLKREKEEREALKQQEKDRRASSKALSEVQRELSEKQSKKLKDQIEKDKREEAEYKKKLKLELEQDKARRKAEREAAKAARATDELNSSQILSPGEVRSQNAGLSQARNDAAPALAFGTSRLNIRLFDGSSIRNTFQATDTLESVREWIEQSMEEVDVAYNIVQLIPHRTFTDESKMLRDLDLCPSATLVLKKISSASSAYGATGDGAVPTLLGYGWSALSIAGKLASSAYTTASYYNPLASNNSTGSSSSSHATSNNRPSGPASSKKKDSEISYNGFPYPHDAARVEQLSFLTFVVDDIPVGRIHSSLVSHITSFNQHFRPVFYIGETTISFMPWLSDYKSRSDAIAEILGHWRKDLENFSVLSGWRDELYGVYTHITNPETTRSGAALAIERSACGLFGVHAYGVHMNGYVQTGPKPYDVQLWVARRSKTKQTYPGMLDNMVAGGMGFGHSPQYTVIKESMEEASLPEDIAKNAYPVGTISYTKLSKDGKQTQPETQIVYDLELPKDVTPAPCDTEVEDFRLWTMDQVKEAIRRGEFKPNCACVSLHFMIRRGVITPENEPDYLDIVHRLHRHIEYPGPKKWPTFME
ncbi:hypothetical protein BGZ76_009229 [Entomortierella beljakovae]|nr:hypothetical protein BGZ76_009229 [Entomortierella beljakovae]